MMVAQTDKKGKHLTYNERILLEAFFNGKGDFEKIRSTKKLANYFGRSVRTIQREIKRGLVEHQRGDFTTVVEYNAEYAQRKADYEKTAKGAQKKLKNDPRLLEAISELLLKKFSPYAIIKYLERENFFGCPPFCEKTLYNYIASGEIYGFGVENLPNKGANRKKKAKKTTFSRAGCALRSIDNRPKAINTRSEVGHWEIDTVKGSLGKSTACLLTLTERKTRAEIAMKMNDGSAESVVSALDKIEAKMGRKNFMKLFKSITADGGSEFMDFDGIEKIIAGKKRTQLFFAHPYRSCERGTNENHNRMIRRFFPKKTDFSKVDAKEVEFAQNWMNNYYRKIHGGKTPLEMLQKEMGKDFALPL